MRSGAGGVWVAGAVLVAAVALASPARGELPAGGLPVFSAEVPAGGGTTTALAAAPVSAKTVDGQVGDWAGESPGFAGATLRSRGEVLYTDHLFDAFGADDGRDAERLALLDPLAAVIPETYRLDALMGADAAGEFGLPAPEELRYATNYGDLEMDSRLDLAELRLGVDEGALLLLARTSTMTTARDAALLVLLDTTPGGAPRSVPFASGLQTDRAEWALLLSDGRGLLADLRGGSVAELPAGAVVAGPDGWANALEARIPKSLLTDLGSSLSIAAATGRPNADGGALADLGTGPNVANVAFRGGEPAREWFDKRQALALHAGSIDGFFAAADLVALAAGANERWTPGAGYHERIFRSSEPLSREQGSEGILQPYGVYIPTAYRAGTPAPLQLWLHWRGGKAHSAAHLAPRIFSDLGEERGTIVVSPRGRGSSSWYVGRGMLDVEEVWRDAHATFSVDTARRYVAGHSMGGWGSFLLSIVHPDWFAAALPASPPVTQGAWTGLDFEGCDDMQFEEYTPCYIQANDGDARGQHTRRMLENLRHVPVAIYHGSEDELVPVSGVARQVERLVQLGYRHRFYLFPTQEHYGPPVWDQWEEGAAYMHGFRIPAAPARVTFKRDMTFERTVEQVNAGDLVLDFSFDKAYWLRGLQPAQPDAGVATFDGRSLAIREPATVTVPDTGGPLALGQTGPYVMTGLAWLANPLALAAPVSNGFNFTLSGASSVTVDGAAMRLNAALPVTGRVTTDRAVTVNVLGVGTKSLPGAGTYTFVLP